MHKLDLMAFCVLTYRMYRFQTRRPQNPTGHTADSRHFHAHGFGDKRHEVKPSSNTVSILHMGPHSDRSRPGQFSANGKKQGSDGPRCRKDQNVKSHHDKKIVIVTGVHVCNHRCSSICLSVHVMRPLRLYLLNTLEARGRLLPRSVNTTQTAIPPTHTYGGAT